MTLKTFYQKILEQHTVKHIDSDTVLLYADLHIMNEYTSPQAFTGLREMDIEVFAPQQNLATVSHIIPTHPEKTRIIQEPQSALQAKYLKQNCTKYHIPLLDTNDPLQGIEHVVAPEMGLIRPGMVVVCGDSHTTTYGALGALGFGIGTTEVEHVLATQTLVYRPAKNMRISVQGSLPNGTTAKDLILYIISQIGAQGARGYVIEFSGSAIRQLSIEARFTLCNMAVEAGARGALIEPDQKTYAYLFQHMADLAPETLRQALTDWAAMYSDDGASFDMEYSFEARQLAPYVSWGTSPDQCIPIDGCIPPLDQHKDELTQHSYAQALRYTGLKSGDTLENLEIDHVFIGSCTNSRIEDLREVVKLIKGQRVAEGVRAMVVPGSGAVRKQAEEEGIDRLLIDAGFEWRKPGCSMCLAMNDDVLSVGKRCASTTNRNFEGRQGRGSITHLMSPAMATMAAIKGKIVDVRNYLAQDSL